MFDITVLGSANLDLVARASRIPSPGETVLGTAFHEHPGGKGLNQAVAAARSGARTAFIGAVGNDTAGNALIATIDQDGIDREALTVVEGIPTGRAVITVDEQGENSIVVIPGANAHVAIPPRIAPTRLMLAQLEVPVASVITAFGHARGSGTITVLNPAPAMTLPDELLALCDIVIPNEHEIGILGGIAELLARGVRTVVVTRGAQGVDAHTAGRTFHQPAFAVTPIDTTGAGDAFCGAFSAVLASGAELSDAVRWGAAAGALATTVAGAVPSLPDRAAVERLTLSG